MKLDLTPQQLGLVRSLVSIQVENGEESEFEAAERAMLARVRDKIDALQRGEKPARRPRISRGVMPECEHCTSPTRRSCPNCGARVCRNCAADHPRISYGTPAELWPKCEPRKGA